MKLLLVKLAKVFGNIEQTAIRLKVSRDTLYKWKSKELKEISIVNKKKMINALENLIVECKELIIFIEAITFFNPGGKKDDENS